MCQLVEPKNRLKSVAANWTRYIICWPTINIKVIMINCILSWSHVIFWSQPHWLISLCPPSYQHQKASSKLQLLAVLNWLYHLLSKILSSIRDVEQIRFKHLSQEEFWYNFTSVPQSEVFWKRRPVLGKNQSKNIYSLSPIDSIINWNLANYRRVYV